MTRRRPRWRPAIAALLAFAAATCGSAPPPGPSPAPFQEGVASWYGPGFEGRTTASGETFDPEALTAAHASLPFGSRVRVHNLANDRTVEVRINDRGPFAGNRILDLSRRAAEVLDMIQAGVVRVRIFVLERGSSVPD